MSKKTKIIIITGTSGVGKNFLMSSFPRGNAEDKIANSSENGGIIMKKIISFTTRAKRYNEVDGVDYHFIDLKDVDKYNWIEQNTFNNNIYGTTLESFLEAKEQQDKNQSIVHYKEIDNNGLVKLFESIKTDKSIINTDEFSILPIFYYLPDDNHVKRFEELTQRVLVRNILMPHLISKNSDLSFASLEHKKSTGALKSTIQSFCSLIDMLEINNKFDQFYRSVLEYSSDKSYYQVRDFADQEISKYGDFLQKQILDFKNNLVDRFSIDHNIQNAVDACSGRMAEIWLSEVMNEIAQIHLEKQGVLCKKVFCYMNNVTQSQMELIKLLDSLIN